MQEDGVDAHRHSTCISEPALLSNAQVKKRVSSLLRSVAFFLACPFRLEAVTKILTLGVCLFPCVLILVESSGPHPVYPVRKVWKLDAKRKKPVLKIARTQLPLAPAYATTAHGSQGKTLPAALVNFNVDKRTEVTFGTVAASRVRSREDVLILS